MERIWQLQDAKNRFSNLVDKAHREGPQFVTKHGRRSVVVLAVEDYQKLIKPKSDLVSFLKQSPLSNVPIDLKRDKSPGRDIEL